VEHVLGVPENYSRPISGPLTGLKLKERRALCIAAQKYASLPRISENQYIFEARWYTIRRSVDTEHDMWTAINCDSYPSMYLGFKPLEEGTYILNKNGESSYASTISIMSVEDVSVSATLFSKKRLLM